MLEYFDHLLLLLQLAFLFLLLFLLSLFSYHGLPIHLLRDIIITISNLKDRIIKADDNTEDISLTEGKISAQATLLILLRRLIITLHPFMPFITEEIWKSIKDTDEDILMINKISVDN